MSKKIRKLPIMAATVLLLSSMLVATVSATKPVPLYVSLGPLPLTPSNYIPGDEVFVGRNVKTTGREIFGVPISVLGIPATFSLKEDSILDMLTGKGTSHGLVTIIALYPFPSTLRIRLEGKITNFVLLEGHFTILEGTGVFENLLGNGIYRGSVVPAYPPLFEFFAEGQCHIEPA